MGRAKRILAGIGVGLVVVIAIGWVGWQVNGYLDFTRAATRYQDVSIGMSQDEVHYRRGAPAMVWNDGKSHQLYRLGDDPASIEKLPSGASVNSFNHWNYLDKPQDFFSSHMIFMDYERGKLTSVTCSDEHDLYCPPRYGITTLTTEDELIHALGRPTSSKLTPSMTKDISYDDLGATFVLDRGEVFSIALDGRPSQWAVFKRYWTHPMH